jgi:hypothetical protein
MIRDTAINRVDQALEELSKVISHLASNNHNRIHLRDAQTRLEELKPTIERHALFDIPHFTHESRAIT